jgi:phage-related protein (TIGR01555 family)
MRRTRKPGTRARNVTHYRRDGWSNLVTGLNSSKNSKKRHTRHVFGGTLSDDELDSLFFEGGLAARIVKLLPDDMYREGWEYEFPDTDKIKAAEYSDDYAAVFENLDALKNFKLAAYWNRLKGGSAILISVIDGLEMSMPLKPKKITAFEKLKVLDRTEIDFSNILWQNDPTLPRFGLPELYPVKFNYGKSNTQTQMVHYSRIIELHGDTLPRSSETALTQEQRFWGISILQRAEDRLRTLGSSLGSIDQLLEEMGVGKFKFKDLAMLLSSPEGKEILMRRVEVMDLTRSSFRSQFFDSEEDFSRDVVNFTGIPEVLYILFMLIAADTGYPITRLFGVSPGGMNSTGESDMRNYYDGVRSVQTAEILPMVLRLVRIISEWQGIPEPYINFLPLETMNEKEQAEVDKLVADKDKIEAETYKEYINMGVLEPYEVRHLKFGNTLDDIPVPKEEELPEVETLPETENEPEQEDDPQEGDTPEADDKKKTPPPPKPKAKPKKKAADK